MISLISGLHRLTKNRLILISVKFVDYLTGGKIMIWSIGYLTTWSFVWLKAKQPLAAANAVWTDWLSSSATGLAFGHVFRDRLWFVVVV